jgi:hypothetical protein
MEQPVRRQQPTLEVFFDRHGDAWRLYVRGWTPPYVRVKLDEHGEAFPVQAPDRDALRDYMWTLDAPYHEQPTTDDAGLALEASGRSAVMLWEWLDDCLAGKS